VWFLTRILVYIGRSLTIGTATGDTSVFIIPGEKVKNTEERLVVLNRIARSVIEEARENARRMLGSARMGLWHRRDLGA
jgi:hypothetical protein